MIYFQRDNHPAVFVLTPDRENARVLRHVLGLRVRDPEADEIRARLAGIFTGW